MTNYEKIKFLLEMGVYKGVEVESNNMYQSLYITHMDGDNLVAIEDYTNIYVSKQDIEMHDITSITPIPNPPKLLPVGTKVRVFEEYRSNKVDKEAIYTTYGMNFETYTILISVGEDGEDIRVPARAVVPVLD